MATKYIINGQEVTEEEFSKDSRGISPGHPPRGPSTAGWPMRSDGLAVWPSQVKEAEAHARKIGVPTSFDPKTGQCILTDRGHRARYIKANGVRDNDGGYKET